MSFKQTNFIKDDYMAPLIKQDYRKLKKFTAYLLYAVIIIVIISGLGINYHRTMEYITLGLLNKSLSFNLHVWFFVPLVILIVLHTSLPALRNRIMKK
jgi:thiosulfate reductase cytochrome b subunit